MPTTTKQTLPEGRPKPPSKLGPIGGIVKLVALIIGLIGTMLGHTPIRVNSSCAASSERSFTGSQWRQSRNSAVHSLSRRHVRHSG